MSVAKGIGQTGRATFYEVSDNELAVGSTLGSARATTIIKASGSIEKVFSPEFGESVFGTIMLRHYEARSGMYLSQSRPGTYFIHPSHQVHEFRLPMDVYVSETIFVLSDHPTDDYPLHSPAVYQLVELTNEGSDPIEIITYAYAVLRGTSGHDILARYDSKAGAFVVWNKSKPEQVRVFGCSDKAETWETTLNYAKAVAETCPGPLSKQTTAPFDPLGALQHTRRIEPGQQVSFSYLASFGNGEKEALSNYRKSPPVSDALNLTRGYYQDLLTRSVVLTPDPFVNRGVLWAKANMLRVETKAPTGWCFVNDPTRSNNSVGRDTAWFGFGADYLTPDFAGESLEAYVRLQEKNGKIIEYYDIRNNRTEDYGLNINDNTPLLIMALWHHCNATGDNDFLKRVYPAAAKAARYLLSQRNEQGLVWCTATGTSDWGIIGWRNVIPNYRLSGATTEVNSESYAALRTVSNMARVLGKHEESAEFESHAGELRDAINQHLFDKETGLYYLNIDLDGNPRSDITSDLVFPVMFGVADDHTAARIIGRLSNDDFWTTAGIRTSPRDAPNYTPNGGWGLLGGVWVGVSFWYAFAAARHSPEFMAHALSTSFRNYSTDPRRNNTVPGQFSEWLNGETLVNEGMMLSPWFPPRYLWAAIEGVAGFDVEGDTVTISPRLAPDWKWMAVQNLPHRGKWLTWFAVRMPDLHIYTNFLSPGTTTPFVTYEEDVTSEVHVTGEDMCAVGLRHGGNLLIFTGNTAERTATTSLRCNFPLSGKYRLRMYNSMTAEWSEEEELLTPEHIFRGITVKLERKGFCVLDLRQEV